MHRPNVPYPVTIQPKGGGLPNVLKRSYYKPGIAEIGAGMNIATGRRVTNEWVSDTPGEFRTKLKDAFNLGTVKCELISLISDASKKADDKDAEPNEEQGSEE